MLHEVCDLPAIRILLNEGMVLLSSPNGERSSTGSIPLEDLCMILQSLPRGQAVEIEVIFELKDSDKIAD